MTNGQTDISRSTRLLILIKNTYTLYGRKRIVLPVTYFSTNPVYPFTLRVRGIMSAMTGCCRNHFWPPLDRLYTDGEV